MVSTFLIGLAVAGSASELDIIYRVVDGVQVKADFYAPAIRNPKGDPFAVVVHGGGWTGGKKEDMAMICEGLAKVGIASATVQYRLAPTHKYPAQLDDVQAAVRFFRSESKKFNLSATKMGAVGASAGGHLSLLLGFSDTRDAGTKDYPDVSSRVQYVFNIFGPTDFRFDFDRAVAGFVSMQVTGKPYQPEGDIAKQFSPISYIDSKAAEVFTLHGEADQLVPVKQAKRLDEALKAVSIPHTMRLIPGMKHEVNLEIPECKAAVDEAVKFLLDRLTRDGKEL
jgi:acetyl esterase/lipase